MKSTRLDTGVWTPLRIVFLYVLFGSLWIFFSDSIVLSLTSDPSFLSDLQTYKGWLFILTTAVMLFWLISRMTNHGRQIIKDLQQAEAYNRNLFDLSPIGLALCTMDGRLLDVNPAYAAIIGRTVAETMRLSYWDITPEKYAEQEKALLASLKTTGRYGPYEKEYIHKDGHLVPVRLQGQPVEKDGAQCIWSSVEDISESKRAEAALRLSEEKFSKSFRNSPEAISLTSLSDSKFVEVNESFLRLSGYTIDEIIGRTTNELCMWVVTSAQQRYLDLIHEHGRVRGLEADFRTKSGEVMHALISGEVIEVGKSKYLLSVMLDITKRKLAEEERQLFFSLAQSSKEFIGIADLNFIPFYANAAALELIGLPNLEAVRKVKLQDFFFPEDQPFITNDFLPRVLREGTGEVEIRFRHFQTGAAIWVLYNVFTITDMSGKTAGWATVSRNITERKHVEEELRQHREHLEELVQERTMDLDRSNVALQNLLEDMYATKMELEAANAKLHELDQLKSMFIASMSHELRTPLNSIIGFTGIILQGMAGPINVEQRDQLERVYRAGKHLLSLITDVIDIAKIESGKILPHVEEFMLGEVIDEACESFKLQLADKGLQLIKEVPATPVRMKSDRRRLLQCLLNFVSNAVKFSEQGTVVVKVEGAKGQMKEGYDFVEISVSDTGVGIKQEDMGMLFQSFVRLKTPSQVTVPGTVLGLYLTKKLATEVLGGEVAAESTFAEGSVFRIRVPCCLQEAAGTEAAKA